MAEPAPVTQELAAPPLPARDALLALLALAAGCVDAVSFLALGRVLTAAMTGNTLLLGIALGQADVAAALRASIALAGFLLGAVLGAAIVERGARVVVWSPAITSALALELVILVVLALAWPADPTGATLHLLIVAAGLAMGIQSAAALRIGVPGVATTYVTGTLMSLSARLVRRVRSRASAAASPPHCRLCDPVAQMGAQWLAAVWLAYGAGAVIAGAVALWWPRAAGSAAARIPWPSDALLLPIALITVVIGLAAFRFHRRRAKAASTGPAI